MCGIVGYFDLHRECRIDEGTLDRMTQTLIHRGPDSAGSFIDDNLGFGFRRLSIIDLAGGDQPIYNEDYSLVLMCNGEIYNYRQLRRGLEQKGHTFRTNSDVEVLVHLYEEESQEFLPKVNGQFAFVIYDRQKQTLFLARDQVGVNPLFYTVTDGLFIFASEIKAILEHPHVERSVNMTGLDQIFSFPGLVSPQTLFKNIHSVKSGHSLTVQPGASNSLQTNEYWDLVYPRIDEHANGKPDSYYVDRLTELLTQSVDYRLQADVPVGFYLSGGLDSSLIAALIKQVSPDVTRHSFSIGFTDVNKEISETRYQEMVSEQVGSVHHEIVFGWNEIADRMTQMVYQCECPVKESYNTCSMALSEATRQSDITVVLTGEGSDELFAGYVGYRFDQSGLRDDKDYDLETMLEDELREQLWGDPDIFFEKEQFALRETKMALYAEEVNEHFADFDCVNATPVNKERLAGRHPVHQRSYLDFKLRLSDHLLSDHGDRMALANSVEARFPFLDVDLIEFAAQVPPHLKLSEDLTEKYVIKQVARNRVPSEIIDREKFGFRAPGSPFLLQQKSEWINDLLAYNRIKRQGYFNPDVIERIKADYGQPDRKINPHTEDDLLMIVLTFGILLDTFKLPNYS